MSSNPIYKLALLPSLLLLLGLAGPAHPPTAGGTATLTGQVRNPTQDTIAVAIRDNFFASEERITYAHLDDEGTFTLTVPVAASTRADLLYGDEVADLYLDPGTNLDLHFKANDLVNTLKFKANGVPTGFATRLHNGVTLTAEERHRQQMANANNYLAEFNAHFVANDGFQVLPDNIQLYEIPFISSLDYRLKEERKFLEDRAAKEALTRDFYDYAKAEITYADANDRLTYQDLREQVVATEPRLKLTAGYYDFLGDSLLLNDARAEPSEHFQEFITNFIGFTATQRRPRTDPAFYPYCYELAHRYLNGPARLLALGRILQESFRFGHIRQSQALLANYCTLDTKNRFWPALSAELARQRTPDIGTPAPGFHLPNATQDSLSLSSFSGKLVYLSFWKSTSGPCLYDLAYQQDLLRQFAERNIVFVSINLDDNDLAWRQLLVKHKLAGAQLWAGGGLQSTLAQAYGLQELPAYVLIGEDGTILDPKPKRPSNRAVANDLNQSFGKAARYQAAVPLLVQAGP